MHLRTLGFVLFAVLTACVDSPTAPAAAGFSAPVFSVVTQNTWENRAITFVANECSPYFRSGTFTIHLVTQTKTASDGTVTVRQNYGGVGGGRLQDAAGNEYVFVHHGNFAQVTAPDGTYTVEVSEDFRVISPGPGGKEFVTLTLRLEWDGTNLHLASSFLSRCHG